MATGLIMIKQMGIDQHILYYKKHLEEIDNTQDLIDSLKTFFKIEWKDLEK